MENEQHPGLYKPWSASSESIVSYQIYLVGIFNHLHGLIGVRSMSQREKFNGNSQPDYCFGERCCDIDDYGYDQKQSNQRNCGNTDYFLDLARCFRLFIATEFRFSNKSRVSIVEMIRKITSSFFFFLLAKSSSSFIE